MSVKELLEVMKEAAERDNKVVVCLIDSIDRLNFSQMAYPNVILDLSTSSISDNGLAVHSIMVYYNENMTHSKEESPYSIWDRAFEFLFKFYYYLRNQEGIMEIEELPLINYYQQDHNDLDAGGYMTLNITVNTEINGC